MTSLSSYTAFDVDAVMEIIFVLFSVTTLPWTHVVSFFCVVFLVHKCISTFIPVPFCSVVCSSRREPNDEDKQQGI